MRVSDQYSMIYDCDTRQMLCKSHQPSCVLRLLSWCEKSITIEYHYQHRNSTALEKEMVDELGRYAGY